MAVEALVSVAEYLNTSYRSDCDYVDGELRERNFGELDHSRIQGEITCWLRTNYHLPSRFVLPEQRVQVKVSRFRIPDVCVLSEGAPREDVIKTPPRLCVEILSKHDRMSEIMERVDDYFEMGVPACWIIDPVKNHAWVGTPGQLVAPADSVLRAGDIAMPLSGVIDNLA